MKNVAKTQEKKPGQTTKKAKPVSASASSGKGKGSKSKSEIPPKPEGKEDCNCRLEWVCDDGD